MCYYLVRLPPVRWFDPSDLGDSILTKSVGLFNLSEVVSVSRIECEWDARRQDRELSGLDHASRDKPFCEFDFHVRVL